MAKAHALIVDESQVTRHGLGMTLTQASLSYHSVSNAREALSYLRDHSADIIFINNHLPGNQGLLATKAIKSSSWGKPVPTIVCVENKNPTYSARAKEFGANLVLDRQITPRQVTKLVAKTRKPIPGDPLSTRAPMPNQLNPSNQYDGSDSIRLPVQGHKVHRLPVSSGLSDSELKALDNKLERKVEKKAKELLSAQQQKLKQQLSFLQRSFKNQQITHDKAVVLAVRRQLNQLHQQLESDKLLATLKGPLEQYVNLMTNRVVSQKLLEQSQAMTIQTNRKLLRLQNDFEQRFLHEQAQNRSVLVRASLLIGLSCITALVAIQYLPVLFS